MAVAGGTDHTLALADGPRLRVTFRLRVYTATELVRMQEATGFAKVECFGDLEGIQQCSQHRPINEIGVGSPSLTPVANA